MKTSARLRALGLVVLLGSAPATAVRVLVPLAGGEVDSATTTELLVVSRSRNEAVRIPYRLLDRSEGATSQRPLQLEFRAGETPSWTPVATDGARLLELDLPDDVGLDARRTTSRRGAAPVLSPLAIIDDARGFDAGRRGEFRELGRGAALGVVNLADDAASCTIELRAASDGSRDLPRLGELSFSLAPRTLGFQESVFDLLGSLPPQRAAASVVCDRRYAAYATVPAQDEAGATAIALPAVGAAAGGATSTSTVFSLPGTFLVCTDQNYNWQYDMKIPVTQTFRKVALEFDTYVSGWWPADTEGMHTLFWLNKGASNYLNMFGYLNLRGTRKVTRFEVNYGGVVGNAATSQFTVPATYHTFYEYNLMPAAAERYVSYQLTRNGQIVAARTFFDRTIDSFTTNYHFIQFGTQLVEVGPEVPTYGWKFSDFRIEFVP